MNRPKKILINIIILSILLFVFLRSTGLYLTPLSAHRASEQSIHYGPSKVVHIEEFPEGKYILGKYDKWISANTVNKSLFFFWRYGGQVLGIKNDLTKAINISYGMSGENYNYYGIINDEKIKKVELLLDNGEVLTETDFHEDMFIFARSSPNDKFPYVASVKGYDIDDNLIFQEEF